MRASLKRTLITLILQIIYPRYSVHKFGQSFTLKHSKGLVMRILKTASKLQQSIVLHARQRRLSV